MSTTIDLPDPAKLRERIIELSRELALLRSMERVIVKAGRQAKTTREDRDDSDSTTT